MASRASTKTHTAERTYLRSKSVVFFRTREAFGALSNMASGYPITVGDTKILSSEALYQACRFPHMPEVQQLILSQDNAMKAKMVSKPYRPQSREDWDVVRVPIMKWCLKLKLIQNWASFGNVLLKTGDLPIVEQSSRDPFWGAIPDKSDKALVGSNVLGRLLMELRQILSKKPADLNSVPPVDIEDFLLLGKPIGTVRKLTLVHSAIEGGQMEMLAAMSAPAKEKQNRRTPRVKAEPRQLAMFDAPTKRIAASKRNYHVLPSPRGGWDVFREGGKRASAHFGTKSEAMERGRQLAKNQKVELIEHKKGVSARRAESIREAAPRLL